MCERLVEAKSGGTKGEKGLPAAVMEFILSENIVAGGSSTMAKMYARDQSPASKTLCSSTMTPKAKNSFVAEKSLEAKIHIDSPASL